MNGLKLFLSATCGAGLLLSALIWLGWFAVAFVSWSFPPPLPLGLWRAIALFSACFGGLCVLTGMEDDK